MGKDKRSMQIGLLKEWSKKDTKELIVCGEDKGSYHMGTTKALGKGPVQGVGLKQPFAPNCSLLSMDPASHTLSILP